MFNKILTYNKQARAYLLAGIDTLAEAVKVTLGPQGKCVIITDDYGNPRVTKDGVSVAKEIKLADKFRDVGVQLIKEAAVKTVNTVGDATTTSVVLAQSLVHGCDEALNTHISSVQLRNELSAAAKVALENIKQRTITIKNGDIVNIATISANNDPEIGQMIGEAFNKIGKDGIVTVEESQNEATRVDVIKGMRFDKGYVAQHFVTDFVKDICVLENPYILITEHKINNMKDLAFILNQVAGENRAILLIAEDYDDEVLETLKLNKLNGSLRVCAVKAPSFGEYRNLILQDIACLTGGTSITYNDGMEVRDASMSMLGTCTKVLVTKEHTTIIGGKGDVTERVETIRAELTRLESDSALNTSFLVQLDKERIAKLTGGIAVIYVGGTTDIERGERKDRFDDAVAATKAAIEEGIVLGGGLTYYNCMKEVLKLKTVGAKVLAKALETPARLLIASTGYDPNPILAKFTETQGFNAKVGEEKLVDMYKAGIIDAAKASRLALENALSIGLLYLSSECIIVNDIPQPVM